MKKDWDTRVMVEIAVAAAPADPRHAADLSDALRWLGDLEMVPLFVSSLRHGVRAGVWSGLSWGFSTSSWIHI